MEEKIGIFVGLLAIILATALGCATLRSWNDTQEQKSFNRGLKYRKDPKTGMCFAVLHDRGLAVVDKKYCERKSK